MWTTLHENDNRLYVSETVGSTTTEHTYLLPEANYTGQSLANTLQSTLNTNKTLSTNYTVLFEYNIGKITISNPTPDFIIMTRETLVGTSWNGGAPLAIRDVRDCNDVIGNTAGSTSVVAGGASTCGLHRPHTL